MDSNTRKKGSNSLVLPDYFYNRPAGKHATASRHYEAVQQGWVPASGLLDMQRHCLSSQTFDEKPEQAFVEAFAFAAQAHAPLSTNSCPVHLKSERSFVMELFSSPWWSALLAIVLIDLVLAGDNAIVIALAARNLPPHLQKKAIAWGTVGAIVVRSIMTVGVVWLLKIPGLMLVGGLGLLWIAYKLLADQGSKEHDGPVVSTFWGAMKTIVVADALMGIDNVLGVAGAAHGAFDLVVIGLLISVPIVVFGSSVVLKLVERFPIIIQLGAAVLAFTAAKMIVSEPLLVDFYGGKNAWAEGQTMKVAAQWATYVVAVAVVLGGGWLATRRSATAEQDTQVH
jgi:YjbE family integral membrane protein